MNMNTKLGAAALVVLLLTMNAEAAGGFSAGPATLLFENVMPGQTVEKTIVLGGDEVPINATINASGKLAEWITFRGVGDVVLAEDGSFTLANGEHRISAVLSVPKETPEYSYAGRITIKGKAVPSSGSGVELSFGSLVTLDVNATVTKKRISSLQVISMGSPQNQLSNEPLYYELTLQNKGNTDIHVKIKTILLDRTKTSIISSKESEIELPFGRRKGYTISITDTPVHAGMYYLSIDLETESGTAWSGIRQIRLLSAKTTEQPVEPSTEAPEKTNTLFLAAAAVVVLAVAYAAYRRKRSALK